MIDQLPEALILKILSSLPTKTVLSTSSLSKEWQSQKLLEVSAKV